MKTLKDILSRLKNFMPENKLYIGIWMFAVLIIVGFNTQTTITHKFVGVTDSKEVNINSKHAVVIKSINVIPGQPVKKGQLLVELEREDLRQQINEVSHNLEELRAEYKLNSDLTLNLKSIKTRQKIVSKNITADQSNEGEALISIQIRSLENRLSFLKKEEEELYIFSGFEGHIGSVHYKNGESASPFDPILTMHKTTPTFVRGYIHENLSHKIAIHKKVTINALSSKQNVIGTIKSVGTRIIEFPERFRRSSESKIWGREVMVQLPKDNTYLLGEKVFMEMGTDNGVEIIRRSLADDDAPQMPLVPFNLIPIQRGNIEDRKIEPSGLVYIKDFNKYMMISDDNHKNEPLVFLLNADGQLDSHIIKVDGIDEIKDMESITEDEDGFIYIASSMSPSNSGKVAKERKKIIKMKREGLKLSIVSNVNVYDELDDLVKAKINEDLEWVQFLMNNENTKQIKLKEKKHKLKIDVEGMIIQKNDIFLGLRNPIKSSREVVILKISNATSVFKDKKIRSDQVSIWKKITLPVHRETDRHEGISDMMLKDGVLYFITASNKFKNMGRLLKAGNGKNVSARELVHFADYKPEGLTYDPILNELVVAFDNNSGKKLFMATVPIN